MHAIIEISIITCVVVYLLTFVMHHLSVVSLPRARSALLVLPVSTRPLMQGELSVTAFGDALIELLNVCSRAAAVGKPDYTHIPFESDRLVATT